MDPRENIFASPLPSGMVKRSGERAAEILLAARFDFTETTISALQFTEVNVVCACRDLETALWARPYPQSHSSESLRSTGRTSPLHVQSPIDFTIALPDGSSKLYPEPFQSRRAPGAAGSANHLLLSQLL